MRYALRTLARNGTLSIAATLVLALGIGANSAIFTVVRAVLLAPLSYPDPDRLVRLYERDVVGPTPYNVVSAQNFYDWRDTTRSYASMGFYSEWGASFSPSDGGLPENVSGAICDSGFFPTLGVQAAQGRIFREEDDRQDASRVIVISSTFARRRNIALNSAIRLDGEAYTVIGIMPAGFDYPAADTLYWLPVNRLLRPNFKTNRGNHRFSAIARLKPGVSVEHARTELDSIAVRIHRDFPDTLTGKGANVVPLADRMVSGVRTMLLVLLGAVGCVLLIACVNVGNLLLARAIAARREVAVRIALGASRVRIARQFLTEGVILAAAGAAAGILLANAGTRALISMAGYIPRIDTVRVNATVLAFTAGIAILTGVGVGLVPALTAARGNLSDAMREGGRGSTAGRRRGWVRDGVIAAQIALSLILLMGAGLMLKSFARLRAVEPGFNPDRLLTLHFSLPAQRYETPVQIAGFYRDVLDKVRATPAVQSACLITVPPLGGHFMDNVFTIDGRAPLPPGQFIDAVVREADPDYFRCAGIPLKRGRVFTSAEWLTAADKAVITEGMAAAFFPNEDPIGKRIRTSRTQSYEIVGIVGDTRQKLAAEPEPMMYFPLFAGDTPYATLMVRAAGDPNLLSLPVQKQMRAMDADLPAVTVKTMDEVLWGSTQQNRFGLTLIALFAVLAVVLAAVGLYGVLAYSVGQRANELGIRIALGAQAPAITRLVVWQGFRPAIAGIVAGIAGAFATTRLLQTMLFDVKPGDPLVAASVVVLLTMVTLIASAVPAWRASRIDPAITLRAE